MTGIVEKDISERQAATIAEDPPVALAVKSALTGNRAGLEKLVSMYQARIFRLAYYRTGSRMDAEDLTQDIFIKAFNGLPALKNTERFGPWLFRIAVNRVRDFQKKKRILLFFGLESNRKYLESSSREIHDEPEGVKQLMRKEFWDNVRRLMAKFSRGESEVFLLRFLDELSIREIAQVLCKSESTVKTHLYRAIEKFKANPELIRLLQGEIQ